MELYQGKGVYGGIAIGKIKIYRRNRLQVRRTRVADADAELLRYRNARQTADGQFEALRQKALGESGKESAAILEAYQVLLEDADFNEAVEKIIRSQNANAEYAVAAARDSFLRMFETMDDDYLKARAADMQDISERLIALLSGNEPPAVLPEEPVILLAEDLSPSETAPLDPARLLSFVTVCGSPNSHTAILAGMLGIPALVQTPVPLDDALDGMPAIVDGAAGTLCINPDEAVLALMKARRQDVQRQRQQLLALRGKENITLNGQKILLYANIGNIRELPAALQNDAGGIGLFRSEFIYLERKELPTEEEQFRIYRQAAETMAGKRVVIRTLDIGADKQCGFLKIPPGENPALGCRAIRLCLMRPDLFKTQLRALLRASRFGSVAILYPMISGLAELRQIREIVSEARAELDAQGTPYGRPEQGIMIETPAAALISDLLAREVDFFSIGTNDLTQYALAVDRQSAGLDAFYDAHHPAVLRMIAMTVDNAHKAGIRAGICGELAADPTLTGTFLAMGVDELSVSPGSILPLRKIIRETDTRQYHIEELLVNQGYPVI